MHAGTLVVVTVTSGISTFIIYYYNIPIAEGNKKSKGSSLPDVLYFFKYVQYHENHPIELVPFYILL